MENSTEIIIKMKRCIKEMEIASANSNENSGKWIKHLSAVLELECLKLRNLLKEH